MAWVTARRARGVGWRELSRELGVPARTLKYWAILRPEPEHVVALRPIDVIDEPSCRTVTVVASSGLRIEGVMIADVITILRGLA